MDTKSLIKEAQARFNHTQAKQILKEKYQAKLIVASQGGLWKITPELLVFLKGTESEEMIITDSYDNPVTVNVGLLFEMLRDTYNTVMQSWYDEFQELRKNR